jgi:hypothetical protein
VYRQGHLCITLWAQIEVAATALPFVSTGVLNFPRGRVKTIRVVGGSQNKSRRRELTAHPHSISRSFRFRDRVDPDTAAGIAKKINLRIAEDVVAT